MHLNVHHNCATAHENIYIIFEEKKGKKTPMILNSGNMGHTLPRLFIELEGHAVSPGGCVFKVYMMCGKKRIT